MTKIDISSFFFSQEKINVMPNVRALQQALRDEECNLSHMNIPEYLVYASKRYCNYKAIVAAIEQSTNDVDVKFFAVIIKLFFIFKYIFLDLKK